MTLSAAADLAATTAQRMLAEGRPGDAMTVLYNAWRRAPADQAIFAELLTALQAGQAAFAAHLGRNDLPEALSLLTRLLVIAPGAPETAAAAARWVEHCAWRGLTAHRADETDLALRFYQLALSFDPAHSATLHRLGVLRHQQGDAMAAVTLMAHAWRIQPGDAGLAGNLAAAAQNALVDASRRYVAGELDGLPAAGMTLEPLPENIFSAEKRRGLGELLHNASFPLYESGRIVQSLACSETALRLHDDPMIYNQVTLTRLKRRNYATAWNPAEWRRVVCARAPWMWDGVARDSTLTVFNQYGFGDLFQFMRYLPEARRRVGRLYLAVNPALHGLLRCSPLLEGVELIARREDVVADHIIETLSLPNALGLGPEAVTPPRPYLVPPADLVADWRRVTRRRPGVHVGVAWGGKFREFEARTYGLARLAPLFAAAPAHFIGLQNNVSKDDLYGFPLPDNFTDFGVYDWLNLAAIIAGLDLVIAPDSFTAHLAAALGVETWVILRRWCEWRWHEDGPRSDWYPHVRLFRQQEDGVWEPALAEATSALATFCADRAI